MKYCEKCGRQMEDAQRFCLDCGCDMAMSQKAPLQLYNGGQQNYNNGQQYNSGYQQMPYNYGYQQPGYGYLKTNGMGIASLVCALVGICFFGALLEPLAIIFGGVGISQCNRQPNVYKGKGLAIAGLVIGIIGLAFNLFMLMVVGSIFGIMAL